MVLQIFFNEGNAGGTTNVSLPVQLGVVSLKNTVHAVPDLRIAGGRLGDGFTNIRVLSLTRQERDPMYRHPERGMIFLWLR